MEQLPRAVDMGLSCRIHGAFEPLSQLQRLGGAEWIQEFNLVIQLWMFYHLLILKGRLLAWLVALGWAYRIRQGGWS